VTTVISEILKNSAPTASELSAGEKGRIPFNPLTPRFILPLLVTEAKASGVSSTDDSSKESKRVKERLRIKRSRDARKVRLLIMEQLLNREFSQAKRQQLLRLLATLGMTRAQYIAFTQTLSARDVARATARRAGEERLRVHESPTSHEETTPTVSPYRVPSHTSSTRASLYAQTRRKISA
jgi:hypothetical protein